jgi:hypothetical protein
MAQYTLMLRESGSSFAHLSPADMQAIVQRYSAWSDSLKKAGKLAGSHKLRDREGRTLRRDGAKVIVSDGPYTEGKEVLGGLFVVLADSYDEALKIADDCPHLDFGSIEVREIEIMQRQ